MCIHFKYRDHDEARIIRIADHRRDGRLAIRRWQTFHDNKTVTKRDTVQLMFMVFCEEKTILRQLLYACQVLSLIHI